MDKKAIALIKETRQSCIVKKIMDTISPELTLKSSDKVAIKINLSGPRERYANTHYETVESLIFYLKDKFGIEDISVVEGSDGAYYSNTNTWEIFYKFRYKEVELNGARLINLDELPHKKRLKVETIAGEREVSVAELEADYLISVVPPKTHNLFPAVMSIPNLLGFVTPEHRAFVHGTTPNEMKKLGNVNNDKFQKTADMAGKNFAALLEVVKPNLTIIDGLYGMEGKGPVKGSPVFHGFAVASEDTVLADSLTAFVMGMDVNSISYIKYAAEMKLGHNRWTIVNGVEPATVKFPYRPHPVFQKQRYNNGGDNRKFRKGGRYNERPNPGRKNGSPKE